MRSPVIAALALGLCTGCLLQHGRLTTAGAAPAPASAPLSAPTPAMQTGTLAPVLIPMQTLLLQLQNTGETVSTSNDIIVHSRSVDNAYDAANGEKRLGFTGLISPLGLGSQASAGPDSSQAIAMSMGVGILRGIRPRLTTHIISGGAEGSTIIAYANQNTQWICLVEGTLMAGKRGTFTLLTSNTVRNFTDNMTIIVASRPNPTQAWSLDGPRALTAAERAVCQAQWTKAQTAGIIAGTEPFPP
jgi:hypothetical protein